MQIYRANIQIYKHTDNRIYKYTELMYRYTDKIIYIYTDLMSRYRDRRYVRPTVTQSIAGEVSATSQLKAVVT